jgi:hypothetical protein
LFHDLRYSFRPLSAGIYDAVNLGFVWEQCRRLLVIGIAYVETLLRSHTQMLRPRVLDGIIFGALGENAVRAANVV